MQSLRSQSLCAGERDRHQSDGHCSLCAVVINVIDDGKTKYNCYEGIKRDSRLERRSPYGNDI